MKISVRWLNEYLEPGDVSPDEAQTVLTSVGFPIESAEALPTGDTCLDVEVTSNRGDVLSHIGVAREIAAATGRRLRLPQPGKVFDWHGASTQPAAPAPGGSADVGTLVTVDNQVHDVCPLFTARVIRSVAVGPSPAWLVTALESVGLRSINTVVDVTNFVAFEYGQPTHVFDLNTFIPQGQAQARVVVRRANKGEKLALLDGQTVTLKGDEVVVADDTRAVSLAGVMGGSDTGVTTATTDVLLEAATWNPVSVRRAARRFGIRTDASYRFERTVDPRTIDAAARRAAALIVRLAGGRLLPGVIEAGRPAQALSVVRMRPARCRSILGSSVTTPEIQRILEAHELVVRPEPAASDAGSDPTLACTIPAHRPDLEREIDLIEEVARTHGLDKLPVADTVASRITSPQGSEKAVALAAGVLAGLGFFETVTFTFVPPKSAKPFTPASLRTMEVCDGRRRADPVLRPSAILGLLECRRANQDRGVKPSGGTITGEPDAGVRLFELSSVFLEAPPATGTGRGTSQERRTLSLLVDASFPAQGKQVEKSQAAVRLLRGAIEAVVLALAGTRLPVRVEPIATPPVPAFDAGACAEVFAGSVRLGVFGLINSSVQSAFGLDVPVACAELDLDALVGLYPPRSLAQTLPAFPAIERDLSLIVAESTPWARIDALVGSSGVALLEGWRFVTTYRGAQAGEGKKSVTLRLVFRDPAGTLTHDKVTPQVDAIIGLAQRELGATVRT